MANVDLVFDHFEKVMAEHLGLDPKSVVAGSMTATGDSSDDVEVRWDGFAHMDLQTFTRLINEARRLTAQEVGEQ